MSFRPLCTVAEEVYRRWKPVNYAAKPYLEAMLCLQNIEDTYGLDSGRSVVAYFLSNATSWRGEDARRIKAELKAMLKACDQTEANARLATAYTSRDPIAEAMGAYD